MKRFRAQVTFPDGVSGGSLYLLLCSFATEEVIGGVRSSDGALTWMATEQDEDGLREVKIRELCTVTPGVCYEVTASFSDKDDDGNMTAAVTVTPRGQPPFATISIRCLAAHLHIVNIYNFEEGETNIGEVEVEYESEDGED